MIKKFHLSRRQVIIYAIFIISFATFLFLYSWTDNTRYLNISFFENNYKSEILREDGNATPSAGFLIYSEVCQIPDLDPYDPTVKNMIELQKPLDCSKKSPALTYTINDTLIIDFDVIERFENMTASTPFVCCYSILRRGGNETSDNKIIIEDNCTVFSNGTVIDEEFIEVKCFNGRVNFYTNYHSFILEKPSVEERCQNITSRSVSHETPRYSIMIIGVDSVSRLNMHRQFPETLKYLKEDMNAVEMYGYNKIADNTFPNVMAFMSGYHINELPLVCRKSDKEPMDNCTLMWTRYKDIGYRTFYAEDTPQMSSFNFLKPGFHKQPTDYYNRPFILRAQQTIGWDWRMWCELCIGPLSETEVILDWLEKFASKFHNRSYFALAWINSLTHDYLNYGSYGDHFYFSMLKRLHSVGSLNNTIVIFLSDHGMRWGPIRNTYIGRLEERLPILLISFPPSFRHLYPQTMTIVKRNAHRLITPFDLYATLENLLEFNGTASVVDTWSVPQELVANFTSRARSLFAEIDKNRSCSDASIAEHWCTCQKTKEVPTNDAEVIHVALYLVDSVNSIIRPRNKVCSILRLNKVMGARLIAPTAHLKADNDSDIFDYTVVVRTKPGGAVFEGTIRFVPQKYTHQLLGSVSRLNVYGNQSSCVDDAILRKYCYCK